MPITIDAIGLDKAEAMGEYVRAAIAAYQGCYYRGATRTDGHRNAEIVEYLKENDPSRDLKTLSDENADVIALAWKGEVDRQMDNMAERAAMGGKASTLSAQQVARAASGAGFREASKVVLRMLRQRIESNLTADDSGNLSSAAQVSEPYAKQREKRYGVAQSEVYKASGQLLSDMDPSNSGQVVLVPGTGGK